MQRKLNDNVDLKLDLGLQEFYENPDGEIAERHFRALIAHIERTSAIPPHVLAKAMVWVILSYARACCKTTEDWLWTTSVVYGLRREFKKRALAIRFCWVRGFMERYGGVIGRVYLPFR
jgi:hypothetical protein